MPTSIDVKQRITDGLAKLRHDLPYNQQDEQDQELSELFFLKTVHQATSPRLDKIEKAVKERVKAGSDVEVKTDNYHQFVEYGTARSMFDADAFISAVSTQFKIPKHKLIEIKTASTKSSATPVSIKIELLEEE